MITSFRYSLSTIMGVLGHKPSKLISAEGSFLTISTSSKECIPGTLFVPLKDKRDGHEFIRDALSKGATGYLCEKNHPILGTLTPEQNQKAIMVDDTLVSLGLLARFHRNRFRPIVIAVTGSSGKTTTKELLGNLFRFLPKKQLVITEKNYNNEIGVPFTMFRITEYTKVVICEMGMNHRGEIERLSKIARPDLSLITNIGSAHIENLKSPKNIAEEKSDIILGMKKGSTLFLPDDTNFKKLVSNKAKKNGIQMQVWKTDATSILKVKTELKSGFQLLLGSSEISWKIPGKTLLSNVRGMAEVGKFLGLEEKKIVEAIKTYKAPSSRLNIINGYFKIIDDTYNANPESMLSSIQASHQVADRGSLVLVLGTMKELGKFSKFYHEKIGEFLKQYPEVTLITFGKDAEWISLKRKTGNNFNFPDSFDEFGKMVEIVRELHPKGTTILVKGSRSMKMERIVESLKSIKG